MALVLWMRGFVGVLQPSWGTGNALGREVSFLVHWRDRGCSGAGMPPCAKYVRLAKLAWRFPISSSSKWLDPSRRQAETEARMRCTTHATNQTELPMIIGCFLQHMSMFQIRCPRIADFIGLFPLYFWGALVWDLPGESKNIDSIWFYARLP